MLRGCNDLQRFTMGDCHYLARAIHNRTGWPMGAVDSPDGPDLHAFVWMPDGRLLDIHGAQTPAQMQERWEDWRLLDKFTWPELRVFSCPPTFGKHTYTRAGAVAERLITEVQA